MNSSPAEILATNVQNGIFVFVQDEFVDILGVGGR
jgi:hypothetical protein